MEAQTRFCTTPDGAHIAYVTFGQGPSLVIANGCWLSASHDLEERFGGPFYRTLAQNNTLVLYDRRGSGLSDRERTDFTVEADYFDLRALVDHLDLERFALLGNCALGGAALTYAARNPERLSNLILYAAWAYGPSMAEDEIKSSFISQARSHWGLGSRTLAGILVPESDGEIVDRIAAAMRETCDSETAAHFLELIYSVDVTGVLADVQTPTLVMQRQHDRGVPFRAARELCASLPNARLVGFEGHHHLISYGDFEVVTDAIQGFLGGEVTHLSDASDVHAHESQLPSGTAIILFADIVGSTALTERIGDDAFRKKARKLDDALRAIIGEADGTAIEGKLLGDGVMSVFTSAKGAIDAALRFGEAGESVGLSLHTGIHAGDVIREGNNVYGGAVNIAARIAGESEAGEVLVSDTVRGLARTSAGVSFEDRGEHELKGIDEPQRIYEVRWKK